jgi:hypothetical protein
MRQSQVQRSRKRTQNIDRSDPGPLIRSRMRAGAAATWTGSSTDAIVYVTSTVNSGWFCSVLDT